MLKSITLLAIVLICFQYVVATSVFEPEIRSNSSVSLLIESNPYDPLPEMEPGLSTPFDNVQIFKSALIEAFLPGTPRHRIFSYAHETSHVQFRSEINALAGYEYTHDEDFSYGYLYKGMRLNAQFNNQWSMKSIWHSGAFFGDSYYSLAHSPLVNGFYKRNNDKIWIDNLAADISYRGEQFFFSLGRDKFQIGNSISGSIILSDVANEYGFILGEGSFGDFRLSVLYGNLISDAPLSLYEDELASSKHYPEKHLALHNISYKPRDQVELFFGEAVIYGDRGLDVNYLLPHAFWRVTEHNLQDRDNILIFGGANLKPVQNLTLYTNAIIDEMRYKEIFGSWWGNKYAIQTGAYYQVPGRDKPGFGFEITAVRPWIYTHFLPWTRYSHDGKALGYPKGSNLIDYTAELNYPLPFKSALNSKISYTRQGSEGNIFSLNYIEEIPDIDNYQVQWLQGNISDTFEIKNMLKSNFFAHHRLMLGHSASYDRKNWQHQLYAGWQLVY